MLNHQLRIQERSSESAAIRRLKDTPIGHPMLNAATMEALASIQNSGSNCMTVIVGPPKAGTTVLVKKGLTERLNVLFKGTKEPENSPVLYLSLCPSGAGEFNWKDLDFQILQKLNAPLAKATTTAKPPLVIPSYDRAGPLFREASQDALAQREIKVLILDHGHNLILASGGPKLNEQMEKLLAKGLSSSVHVVLVMNQATYEALDCSGHLASSINVVHLPRYNWGIPEQQQEFKLVLNAFQQKIVSEGGSGQSDGAISFQLEDEAQNIYRATFGLVGLTKELLVNTLARAKASKGLRELDRRTFRKLMPSCDHLLPLAEELSAYEVELGKKQKSMVIDQWLFGGKPIEREKRPGNGGNFERALGRDRVGIPQ